MGARHLKKSDGLLRERVELRYQFIAQKKKAYPVKLRCWMLGVTRSGCDDFLRRQQREPDPQPEEQLDWVKALAESSNHSYGSRRMAESLRALGHRQPPKGQLIHHSDRGVQDARRAFRRLLKAHGIEGSMSRKGDCWYNAVVESFLAH